MSRKSKSLLCSALGGLCVLLAACGCPAQKSPASPFHHAAEPTRDRDWPLEKDLDSEDDGYVYDIEDEDEDEGEDVDDYDEDSSYDESEDETDGDDGDVGDLDLGDDDFEDDDFEDDE